ncbi:MAG: glycosyltransferase family 2 protein [Candidatus Omnitrophica bacterium]|nr:glycosyltransferase family 2 protein [Candidatus Omnitrophota bacterium]
MKVCVVIPTFNESKTIGRLIDDIKALNLNLDILVVDDGSRDDTSDIAIVHGAKVLKNAKNEGKGASLIKGFTYVLQNNFDAAIAMDGDGQHLAQDLPLFVRRAESSDSQIFVGNRMKAVKNMPLVRILTNRFMSWLISAITKQKISDTQCGFRLIKREALEKIKLSSTKYEIESEILIKCSRLGFKIESVPIKTVYGLEISRINPLRDTFRFIAFILKETWILRS